MIQQWRVRFWRLFIWDDLVATSKTFLWFDLAHVGWVRTNKIREDDLGWFPEVLCFLNRTCQSQRKIEVAKWWFYYILFNVFVGLWRCIGFFNTMMYLHFYIVVVYVFFFTIYLGMDPTWLMYFFKSASHPPPRFTYWQSNFSPGSCPIYKVGPYQPVITGVK